MNFKSGSTEMTIDPDKFFPLPMNKLKKFIAILSQADYWDSVEYMEQVKHFLNDRIYDLSGYRSFYIGQYLKNPSNDIDAFYFNLHNEAIRKTVSHIEKLQEKLKKNLEYVENR